MTTENMALSAVDLAAGAEVDGVYLVGTFLGVQEASTWTRPDQTVAVTRPKIGIEVGGDTISVACKDDAQMAEVRRGWVKGDRIALLVDVRPPFGARGSVTYALPGAIEGRSRDWK